MSGPNQSRENSSVSQEIVTTDSNVEKQVIVGYAETVNVAVYQDHIKPSLDKRLEQLGTKPPLLSIPSRNGLCTINIG